jgi:hypothetical protein
MKSPSNAGVALNRVVGEPPQHLLVVVDDAHLEASVGLVYLDVGHATRRRTSAPRTQASSLPSMRISFAMIAGTDSSLSSKSGRPPSAATNR